MEGIKRTPWPCATRCPFGAIDRRRWEWCCETRFEDGDVVEQCCEEVLSNASVESWCGSLAARLRPKEQGEMEKMEGESEVQKVGVGLEIRVQTKLKVSKR